MSNVSAIIPLEATLSHLVLLHLALGPSMCQVRKYTKSNTVESRFLEPPRETKICSRSQELELSGVKLQ